jgi:Protein of unknown function (DUF2844)
MKYRTSGRKMLGTALGAALLVGIASSPTLASLGGDASSVTTDTAKMKGEARSIPAGGYTVNQITLPSGTIVKEYVSAEGKVFAVTWKGESMPDLSQTLGTYFAQFSAAASSTAPHASHHNLTVQQSDLVVQTGGHMRAWNGRAYVPSLLPPNFSVSDIKL